MVQGAVQFQHTSQWADCVKKSTSCKIYELNFGHAAAEFIGLRHIITLSFKKCDVDVDQRKMWTKVY